MEARAKEAETLAEQAEARAQEAEVMGRAGKTMLEQAETRNRQVQAESAQLKSLIQTEKMEKEGTHVDHMFNNYLFLYITSWPSG